MLQMLQMLQMIQMVTMQKINKMLRSPSELYLQPYSDAKHEFKIKYKYEYNIINNVHVVFSRDYVNRYLC